jgi:hypothetical protein
MSAFRNEARGLLGNQYFRWHALPRSQNRFSRPPDFRRLAGGIAATIPAADRPVADRPTGGIADRPTGGIAAVQPSAHPFPLPGHDRAVAGHVLDPFPAPAQPSTRFLRITRRRLTVGATGAITESPPGYSLNDFPTYARP